MSYELGEKERQAREHLCLALDLNDEDEILHCADELSDLVGVFKINFAFTLFGPPLVRRLRERGCRVFLDLKLHDIPNTVGGYADAVTQLRVDIVTIHTAGGIEMMRQATLAADQTARRLGVQRPKFIGVTVLTSIQQTTLNNEMNILGLIENEVVSKARLAATAGLDGIVCSAAELAIVRKGGVPGFLYVTPGVRKAGSDHNDHRRVESYSAAIAAGSDLLVVGRAILGASDRRAAACEVLKEIAGAL
jgi:orotidine-5'-phosphate decarboxylase